MKKYFTIGLILINLVCFAQADNLEMTPLRYKKNTTSSFGVLTIGDNQHSYDLLLMVDSNTSSISNSIPYPSKPNTWFVYLEGAKKIKLLSTIPSNNLNDYRYTVTNSKRLVIGVRDQISKPIAKRIHPSSTNSFGIYDIENETLTFSVYKQGDENSLKSIIICNKKPKKVELVEANLVEVYKPSKVQKIIRNAVGDTTSITRGISEAVNINMNGDRVPFNTNRTYAQITVKPIDNIFLYKIIIKREDNKNEFFITSIEDIAWSYDNLNNLSCRLDIKNFELPGKYEVIIYPKIGMVDFSKKIDNATSLKFKIIKPKFFNSLHNIIVFGIGLLISIILIFGLIILYIKRKNRRKLALSKQQKEQAKTQVAIIRSQLNPHFMFNALAGIQNLMNKNEMDNANKYLSKFARLTRNVLDDKELISLAQEKTLLDDYLQMEQLRFGFDYKIEISENLDAANIEIPSMLLQPFVENAVKHGISSKSADGKITIAFTRQTNDLVLTIHDNGNGFDPTKKHNGLGLSLSKNRIALLNNVYKENLFTLAIQANSSGTEISLTLTDWL